MSNEPRYDVFLSYASHDRPWVSELVSALRASGVRAWFDEAEIQPGDRWQEQMEQALRESRMLILVLGPDGFASPMMFFELGAAIADRKRILALVPDEGALERLPPVLRKYQVVRDPSPREAGRRIAEVVQHRDAA